MTDLVPSGGDPVLDALRAEITRLENLDVVSGLTRIEREELARVRLHLFNEERSGAGTTQEVAPAPESPVDPPASVDPPTEGVEPVPEVPAPSEDQAPPQ